MLLTYSLISIWFTKSICCSGGSTREAAHLYMLGPCLTLQNSRELSMGLSSPSQLSWSTGSCCAACSRRSMLGRHTQCCCPRPSWTQTCSRQTALEPFPSSPASCRSMSQVMNAQEGLGAFKSRTAVLCLESPLPFRGACCLYGIHPPSLQAKGRLPCIKSMMACGDYSPGSA